MIQIPLSLVVFFVAQSQSQSIYSSLGGAGTVGQLLPNIPSNLPFQPPTNGLPLPLQQLLDGNAAPAGQLSPILQAIIANFQAAQQGTATAAAGRSDLPSVSLDLPAVEDGESLSDYIKRCTGSSYRYNSGYNYPSYNSGYG